MELNPKYCDDSFNLTATRLKRTFSVMLHTTKQAFTLSSGCAKKGQKKKRTLKGNFRVVKEMWCLGTLDASW